jgi:hypothetical protein
MVRICNHVTEAVEEKEGQQENPNRVLILQLLARLSDEVSWGLQAIKGFCSKK